MGNLKTPEYERPTISASRLTAIGGEKGTPGCERKLAAHYLFGMKQASSAALEFGSALHASAEHYQLTGAIPDPEGPVARVLSAGAHLLTTAGNLLVEHEHVGTLPDGSPYVAYIDGHSANGDQYGAGTIVIQDLKTTSNERFALVSTDDPHEVGGGPYALDLNLQAMFYAWILLCAPPHQFRAGPDAPWQTWDPAERAARSGRLRWVYFLTKGVPRAWEANAFVTPAQAATHMATTIMPLVARINALHEWHHARAASGGTAAGSTAPSLDEIDRNLTSCGGRGRWCGAGERDACNYDQLGTPALDLVQLKVRPMTSPQDRLAALRARNAAGPAPISTAAAAPPAPVQEAPTASPKEEVSAPVVQDSPAAQNAAPVTANVAADVPATANMTRGQKAAATRAANRAAAPPPSAPPVVGNINPPEVVEALAKLTAPAAPPVVAPAPVPVIGAAIPCAVLGFTTEQIVTFLVAQGYLVTKAAA
ncbi:MAG: hypothetical protein V4593_08385 [Pseudomonadota bacterium]